MPKTFPRVKKCHGCLIHLIFLHYSGTAMPLNLYSFHSRADSHNDCADMQNEITTNLRDLPRLYTLYTLQLGLVVRKEWGWKRNGALTCQRLGPRTGGGIKVLPLYRFDPWSLDAKANALESRTCQRFTKARRVLLITITEKSACFAGHQPGGSGGNTPSSTHFCHAPYPAALGMFVPGHFQSMWS